MLQLEPMAERAACYRNYYRSAQLAKQLHGPDAKPEDAPFRVLFIFKTAERRNNAADRFLRLQPPVLRQAWLTTFEELTRSASGPIWVRPQDYLEVTEHTNYSPHDRAVHHVYRRHSDREALVEKAVRKLPLFDAIAA